VLANVRQQLAVGGQLQHVVEVVSVLKGRHELDNVGMLALGQNVALRLDVLRLVLLLDMLLVEHLDGILLARLLVCSEDHLHWDAR
jgi:hypothetical protein